MKQARTTADSMQTHAKTTARAGNGHAVCLHRGRLLHVTVEENLLHAWTSGRHKPLQCASNTSIDRYTRPANSLLQGAYDTDGITQLTWPGGKTPEAATGAGDCCAAGCGGGGGCWPAMALGEAPGGAGTAPAGPRPPLPGMPRPPRPGIIIMGSAIGPLPLHNDACQLNHARNHTFLICEMSAQKDIIYSPVADASLQSMDKHDCIACYPSLSKSARGA